MSSKGRLDEINEIEWHRCIDGSELRSHEMNTEEEGRCPAWRWDQLKKDKSISTMNASHPNTPF